MLLCTGKTDTNAPEINNIYTNTIYKFSHVG